MLRKHKHCVCFCQATVPRLVTSACFAVCVWIPRCPCAGLMSGQYITMTYHTKHMSGRRRSALILLCAQVDEVKCNCIQAGQFLLKTIHNTSPNLDPIMYTTAPDTWSSVDSWDTISICPSKTLLGYSSRPKTYSDS